MSAGTAGALAMISVAVTWIGIYLVLCWVKNREERREFADIIKYGHGDITRHGKNELRCPGALAIKGEVFLCELHPEHLGWAHSNAEAGAIWQ